QPRPRPPHRLARGRAARQLQASPAPRTPVSESPSRPSTIFGPRNRGRVCPGGCLAKRLRRVIPAVKRLQHSERSEHWHPPGHTRPPITSAPMSLTVVGSIAFDSVKTPFGERDRMLGGTAVHFSLAASFFTEVRPVGPVGEDFGSAEFEVLESHGGQTGAIERVAGGRSFFWRGRYEYDLNVAHTEDTQLGVFGEFEPKLSEDSKAADVLFLANIQPDLQRQVRAQCGATRFCALDSMNLWIDTAKDSLLAAIAEVDCVIVNDAEIRQLTGESNLARAARVVMERGPRAVVAKQGEYGAALF